jgi:hypothetical protein
MNKSDMHPLLGQLHSFLRKNCRPLPWLIDMADKKRKNLRLTLYEDDNNKNVWLEVKVYERGDLYIHLATNDPTKRSILVAISNTMERTCGIGTLDLRQPNRSGWTRVGYLIREYKKIDGLSEKICECLKKLYKYYQTLKLQ